MKSNKENSLLQQQLEYVIENSPFYQKKLCEFISDSGSILSSFYDFPFTTKREILADQKENGPYGSNLCVDIEQLKRIHKTSGTTDRPVILAYTDQDIAHTIKAGARCFTSSGLSSSDVVVHCLNYNMWAGGFTDHQSLEATGAAVIPFGVGNSKNLIETILTIQPTAIHCTPSYLSKLELILKTDFNLQPSDLSLKLGLFGAEPGIQNEVFRNNIEQKWKIKAMNANYGMSDVLSMFGGECSRQCGLHFMANDVLLPELLNTKTMKVIPVESGAEGELVLTNLCKEAQPLIRYRTNDIIKIISIEKCNCGESGFRFEVIGRSDDMFTIKGVNLFLSAIQNIINNYIGEITSVYQVHINKHEPVSNILIKLELRIDSEIDPNTFKDRFVADFKAATGIKPDLHLANEGALPRTEGKSKILFRSL